MLSLGFLRPTKKLREGNVFIGVCLFTGAGIGISGTRSLLQIPSGGQIYPGGGRYTQGVGIPTPLDTYPHPTSEI